MKKLVAILIFAASLAQAQTPQLPYQMFRDWQAVAASRAVASATSLWTDPNTYAFLMDEPNSSTSLPIDNSGNGLAVTRSGATLVNLGTNAVRNPLAENGWYFDGLNDKMTVSGGLSCFSNTTQFTFGLWFQATSLAAQDIYLAQRGPGVTSNIDFRVYTPSSNLAVRCNDGAAAYLYTKNGPCVTGLWYCAVVRYNGSLAAASRLQLWLNGLSNVAVISGTIPTSIEANNWDFTFGGGQSYANFFGDLFFATSNYWSDAEIVSWYNYTGGTNGPVGNIRARLPAGAYP